MSTLSIARTATWSLWIGSLLIAVAGAASAQVTAQPRVLVAADSNIIQELRLRDGTKLVGRITEVESGAVAFQTMGGIGIDLQRRDIVSVREVRGFHHEGQFWENDAADSRLFVAPTARIPAHGRGYFGVYELVVPSFGVGIGGVAMITGGMSLVPGIALDDQVFYIAPKLQLFDLPYVQGAIGAIWVQPGGADEGAGLAFGALTAGTSLASVTGGVGIPLFRENDFDGTAAFFLGGELRVARSIKLMSENWILPGDVDAFALGVRILTGRVVAELAGVTATETDVVLPLVNITFTW